MYNNEQLTELVEHWNANAFKTVSLYSARASIEKRLAPAYNKGYTVEQLKSVIDKVRENNGGEYIDDNIYKTLSVRNIKDVLDETPAPLPDETPAPLPDETPAKPQGGALENAIVDMMKPYIDTTLREQVEQAAARGAIETPLTVITPVGKVDATNKHECFKDVLNAVANGMTLYLYGPAGSGKNVICSQVADALGLTFYYTNSVTQEYKITGYMDAYGKYQRTPFYDAFKNGGLFMLDELDASIPETLVILNAALANGYFTFPNNELVTAHKDFHCIAAGNTLGHGADATYTGRFQLDGATLNRFIPRKIDYSRKIENMLADSDIVNFCRNFRDACEKCGIEHVISYRNIIALAQLVQIWDTKDAIQGAVIRELSNDDIAMIKDRLDTSNTYAAALFN